MAKKDTHKNMATNMIQGLVNTQDTTPQQFVNIAQQSTKKDTTKFTVEIETPLMDKVRLYGVQNKIKLRALFEQALAEYLETHNYHESRG